jgi:LPS-assembly protein
MFLNANAVEEFNFDITEVEILENGNIFKGIKKGTITSNDGIILNANEFIYNKTLNKLNAKGNVVIEDKINKYVISADNATYLKNENIILTQGKSKAIDLNDDMIIEGDEFTYNKTLNTINAKKKVIIEDKIRNYKLLSEDITYLRNQEKIFTKGKTQALINSKYNFESKNVVFLKKIMQLSSNQTTKIIDNNNQLYNLSKFVYSIDREELKADKILIITNYNLPKSDKYYFSSGIFNLKEKNYIGKNTKIELHKDIFDDFKNDPRLLGISSSHKNDITTINKGIFTSCKKSDTCPPWSIKAEKIIHNKTKKQLIYDNAFLRLYDVPVFYLPKFFHPDPSVKRQSGFLQPRFNKSEILGSSLTMPYFKVFSETDDLTITPTIFDKNIQMIQNEYRKVTKNSNLIVNFAHTNNYKSSLYNKKKSINHLFSKFDLDLNLENYLSSNLLLSIERVNNDNYLKVFDAQLEHEDNTLKPANNDILVNKFELVLDHEAFDFTVNSIIYEDLKANSSDKYQYILPQYVFNKTLSENFLNGSLYLSSSGANDLKNTNDLKSNIINDFTYSGFDILTNNGIKNNFNIRVKNLNSVGKDNSNYKSSPQIELMSIAEITSSLPMIKEDEKYKNFLTPKFSLRFNPSDMKNYTSSNKKMDVSNIFNLNRIGLGDSFEAGRSLTVGIDYKVENVEDINKYFDLKLATVFRDKEENFIPKSTTINKKNSNIYGQILNNFSENFNLNYNFSLSNDLKSFEYNNIGTKLKINNFVTSFNYIKESGDIGSSNSIENITEYKFNEENYVTFSTRRNREINLTEYYDLVYEYKNDCLIAGVKFKKSYYEDTDLKPTENLLFTISFIPLTKYEYSADTLLQN